MICPKCSGPTTCVDSRQDGQRRFRRYRCGPCALLFSTVEEIAYVGSLRESSKNRMGILALSQQKATHAALLLVRKEVDKLIEKSAP